MRGFRLNGWQRIGIVLSVVWAIGAAVYEINVINDRYYAAFGAAFRPVLNRCEDDPSKNGVNCAEVAGRAARAAVPTESSWNIAIAALAPIPFFWLIAYALVGLGRWITRGFKPST
jgi:hypothetical protein